MFGRYKLIQKFSSYTFPVSLLITTLVVLKLLMLGVEVDEEYAYMLAYKLANNKLLFTDCYEVHQLATLLPAFLLRLKYTLHDSTYGDILYLRCIGLAVQCFISIFIYKYCKSINQYNAKYITLLFILFTPKFTYLPDYALIQYWFVCLLIFNISCRFNPYIVGFLSTVLCIVYPAYFLVAVFIFIYHRSNFTNMIKGAIVGLSYLLLAMPNFNISCLRDFTNILSDPTHNVNLLSKIKGIVSTSVLQLIIILIFIIISLLLKSERKSVVFKVKTISVVTVTLLYLVFIVVCKDKIALSVLFFIILCVLSDTLSVDLKVISILTLLGHLISSNQGKLFMFRYIVPIVLVAIILNIKYFRLCAMSLFVVLVASNSLITQDFYKPSTDLIYCDKGSLAGTFISHDLYSKVIDVENLDVGNDYLLLGNDNVLYTYIGGSFLSPNVTSTPVFNNNFVEYFNTAEYPKYILLDLKCNEICYVSDEFCDFIRNNYDVKRETNTYRVFVRK